MEVISFTMRFQNQETNRLVNEDIKKYYDTLVREQLFRAAKRFHRDHALGKRDNYFDFGATCTTAGAVWSSSRPPTAQLSRD